MLSILTVTQAQPFAIPFLKTMHEMAQSLRADFCLIADGTEAQAALECEGIPVRAVVRSAGYIESVLDEAVMYALGEYVLRLDDDERCSWPMFSWLQQACYVTSDHWKFPRAHLWGDDQTYIHHLQLWPDHQTRLSTKVKSGGRRTVHAGSPWGGGTVAPVVLEHHKFLVKTPEERRAIAAGYDRVAVGFGTGGMLAFNLPEEAITAMNLRPLTNAFEEAEAGS
jgi:hypothetical protein